jgi:Fe2+ or Zn2+ uptake regulation protein
VCDGCGRVADYDAPDAVERALEEALPRIERDLGFAVSRHVLDLIGLCPACRGPAPSDHH